MCQISLSHQRQKEREERKGEREREREGERDISCLDFFVTFDANKVGSELKSNRTSFLS